MEINVLLATLAQVAALEERLVAARDARDRHTRRDDHLGALGRELADDAGAAHGAVEATTAAQRRLDRELREVEQAAASRRERLVAVAEARQAGAVRSELEALGLLGALETAEAAAGEADLDADRQGVRTRTELGALAQAADRGAAALAAGEQEMERVLALMPDDVVRRLRRLQGRDGQGVAVLRAGACGGCFEQLPAVLVAEVERKRTVVRCQGCGRFVI